MDRKNIKKTNVWMVNSVPIVADTIDDAVAMYRKYFEYSTFISEVSNVKREYPRSSVLIYKPDKD